MFSSQEVDADTLSDICLEREKSESEKERGKKGSRTYSKAFCVAGIKQTQKRDQIGLDC